ncbi:MAG: NUDIX hydrolase [Propionibacteriaceae bacterium]|nr:NUDIX hydrolase [Propionibacteriaceae bacterium]
MTNNSAEKRITAAGTVVLRPVEGREPEVLLVHRPRYDDWSLPKGKINPDEYLAGCAVRETLEEAAVDVRLGMPLDRLSYPVGGGTKTVSYWRARALRENGHKPNDEIDGTIWLPASHALRKVTYADERPLIQQAIELPDSTPLVIVRHGKAMLRANWTGRDQARPLDERGRRQSRLLVPLLEAFGVGKLTSSTSVRCLKTLQPHAKAHRLEVEGWTTLTEEQAEKNPKAVATLMKRLAKEAAESQVPTAICGHRPVLPVMLEAIGVPFRPLQPGAAMVAHLGQQAEVLAVEVHKPRI